MKCWEFMKCGRVPGGDKVDELGVCPAYPNHGQCCARVAGTLCGGNVQGTFACKLHDCMRCEFFQSENYQIDESTVTKHTDEAPRETDEANND